MRIRILPKEEKFFALFEQQAECIAEAAKLLTAAVMGGTSQLGHYVAQVRDIEHKGDEVTHAIMVRLNQTFLTPIDPEDIHRLASCLDDVLDMIDASLGRLMLFKSYTAEPRTSGDSVAEAAQQMSLAVDQIFAQFLRDLTHAR